MRTFARTLLMLAACGVAVASCTLDKQEAPPLTGPSEFGTSVTISVSPDVLQQDGQSQSLVTVTARDASGRPLPNLGLIANILFNGQVVDFGTLSARSIVTNAEGRATLVYTAPRDGGVETAVEIAVTPIGTDFGSNVPRTARIRLVPTGIRLPPTDLVAQFSFTPPNPAQGQTVVFDAQESRGTIAEFHWDFGDGETAVGETVSHSFDDVGTFVVRLTLIDPAGRTDSVSRSVPVGQSDAPVAQFTFSPANPQPNDEVRFNAAGSTAAPGRRIVRYRWDLGDGTTASGQQVSHRYALPRTYNVTLTVTDDIGRTSVITQSVDVAFPDEDDGG